jgi:hypothetical protein
VVADKGHIAGNKILSASAAVGVNKVEWVMVSCMRFISCSNRHAESSVQGGNKHGSDKDMLSAAAAGGVEGVELGPGQAPAMTTPACMC